MMRNDCGLFLIRTHFDKTVKFKIQFSSIGECQRATQALGVYFPIKLDLESISRNVEYSQATQAMMFSQPAGVQQECKSQRQIAHPLQAAEDSDDSDITHVIHSGPDSFTA